MMIDAIGGINARARIVLQSGVLLLQAALPLGKRKIFLTRHVEHLGILFRKQVFLD
jgi:hypothetical protein